MSRRESLLTAVEAALEGAGKPAGFLCERTPLRSRVASDGPTAGIFAISERVDYEDANAATVQRYLTFGVPVRLTVTSDDAPDTALDPYVSWVIEALLSDVTLGGTCLRLRELTTEWVSEEHDETFAGAVITFEALYTTQEADLAAP